VLWSVNTLVVKSHTFESGLASWSGRSKCSKRDESSDMLQIAERRRVERMFCTMVMNTEFTNDTYGSMCSADQIFATKLKIQVKARITPNASISTLNPPEAARNIAWDCSSPNKYEHSRSRQTNLESRT
jgi:hypothetical protein